MSRHIFLITDMGEIDLTDDEHILRNLNWSDVRLKVIWRRA